MHFKNICFPSFCCYHDRSGRYSVEELSDWLLRTGYACGVLCWCDEKGKAWTETPYLMPSRQKLYLPLSCSWTFKAHSFLGHTQQCSWLIPDLLQDLMFKDHIQLGSIQSLQSKLLNPCAVSLAPHNFFREWEGGRGVRPSYTKGLLPTQHFRNYS